MHVTPRIAASGFLLASGSAYAGPGRPVGHDDTLYVNDLVESPQPRRSRARAGDTCLHPYTLELL
jgi:hypothetical protein